MLASIIVMDEINNLIKEQKPKEQQRILLLFQFFSLFQFFFSRGKYSYEKKEEEEKLNIFLLAFLNENFTFKNESISKVWVYWCKLKGKLNRNYRCSTPVNHWVSEHTYCFNNFRLNKSLVNFHRLSFGVEVLFLMG